MYMRTYLQTGCYAVPLSPAPHPQLLLDYGHYQIVYKRFLKSIYNIDHSQAVAKYRLSNML